MANTNTLAPAHDLIVPTHACRPESKGVNEGAETNPYQILLRPGEHYAGLVLGKDGEPSYHLVLLPGQADDVTWESAMEWAGQHGGEYVASLPTRREQALLYANLKEEFEERAYWSCEAHESESGRAWFQGFGNGYQDNRSRCLELRARAVRRVVQHNPLLVLA